MKRKQFKQYLPGIGRALLIVVVFLGLSLWLQSAVGEEELLMVYYENRTLGIILIIVLKALAIIIAPISGAALYSVAGSILPFGESVLLLSIGNFIGATVFYRIGTKYGDKAVKRFFGKQGVNKTHEILDYISTPKGFILANIVLAPLGDLLCLAAGMSGIRYLPYIIISMFFSTAIMIGVLLGADYFTGLFLTVF